MACGQAEGTLQSIPEVAFVALESDKFGLRFHHVTRDKSEDIHACGGADLTHWELVMCQTQYYILDSTIIPRVSMERYCDHLIRGESRKLQRGIDIFILLQEIFSRTLVTVPHLKKVGIP